MNSIRWVLFLVWTGSLLAQSAVPAISPEEEAEWAKIRALKTIYEDAVGANQIEKLKPYVASQFHGVLVTGAEARSFDELLRRNEEIRNLIGATGSYRVKVAYDPGSMFGDIAVATGTAQESITTSGGKHYEFVSRWLVNLKKEDGAWKLYRLQATLDPVDNVFVQDALKYTQMVFGVGGLGIGALLGYFARKLFS